MACPEGLMKHAFVVGLVASLTAAAAFFSTTTGCTTTKVVEVVDPSLADSGTADTGAGPEAEPTVVDGHSKKLFGTSARSFAKVNAAGTVVGVGVVFALKSFTSGPADHPFQDDLVLEMPDVAKEQTMLNHLRANWLPGGHGPDPYGEPHFDFHFLRGTIDEIDALDCRANKIMPKADKIPEGYGQPELCVNAMGYHSWPQADTKAGGKFTGSLIMGFWDGNVIFLEPMIPVATFEKKETFEIAVNKPESAGGATTLYPTKMVATWLPDTEEYSFEFGAFETID